MLKVAHKAHDSSHNGINFLAQSIFISDLVKSKCKCLLDSIEYVFNWPIHCMISTFLEIKKSMQQCENNDFLHSV